MDSARRPCIGIDDVGKVFGQNRNAHSSLPRQVNPARTCRNRPGAPSWFAPDAWGLSVFDPIDSATVGASRTFGTTPRQTMLGVRIPLAGSTVMAAINPLITMVLMVMVLDQHTKAWGERSEPPTGNS